MNVRLLVGISSARQSLPAAGVNFDPKSASAQTLLGSFLMVQGYVGPSDPRAQKVRDHLEELKAL